MIVSTTERSVQARKSKNTNPPPEDMHWGHVTVLDGNPVNRQQGTLTLCPDNGAFFLFFHIFWGKSIFF